MRGRETVDISVALTEREPLENHAQRTVRTRTADSGGPPRSQTIRQSCAQNPPHPSDETGTARLWVPPQGTAGSQGVLQAAASRLWDQPAGRQRRRAERAGGVADDLPSTGRR